MIAKSYIKTTLFQLDRLYNKSTCQKQAIYFSKLALIELCGWIEEAVDDIILKHAHRKLKERNNKDFCRNKIVKSNYGFKYEKNIRQMLIKLIGLIETEKLEKKLEINSQITMLTTYLNNLILVRNEAAHTHLKGYIRTYNAPSMTLADFNNICTILDNIDSELRNK